MKIRSISILLLTCSILLILIYVGNKEFRKDDDTPVQVLGDAFSSLNPQSIDDIIAHSDHVVLGTVVHVLDNNSTEEYLFNIDKQYKGETNSKEIHVYEAQGTLATNQTYVLFLEASEKPYYPHITYTSIVKEAILLVNNTHIQHQTSLLAADISLNTLEKTLTASPGIKAAGLYKSNSLFPNIEEHSGDELHRKAELIAHVVPTDSFAGNKYVQQVSFEFKTIFKSSNDYDPTTVPFMMPSTIEIGEEYILFAQLHDGLFYTVSLEDSIIPKSDRNQWNEALVELHRLYPQ